VNKRYAGQYRTRSRNGSADVVSSYAAWALFGRTSATRRISGNGRKNHSQPARAGSAASVDGGHFVVSDRSPVRDVHGFAGAYIVKVITLAAPGSRPADRTNRRALRGRSQEHSAAAAEGLFANSLDGSFAGALDAMVVLSRSPVDNGAAQNSSGGSHLLPLTGAVL